MFVCFARVCTSLVPRPHTPSTGTCRLGTRLGYALTCVYNTTNTIHKKKSSGKHLKSFGPTNWASGRCVHCHDAYVPLAPYIHTAYKASHVPVLCFPMMPAQRLKGRSLTPTRTPTVGAPPHTAGYLAQAHPTILCMHLSIQYIEKKGFPRLSPR